MAMYNLDPLEMFHHLFCLGWNDEMQITSLNYKKIIANVSNLT